jgi:hypothetical protein
MPKRPLELKIRLLEYKAPRTSWRAAIHRAVTEVQRTTPVEYGPDDRLEVALKLCSTDARSAEIHDVDNRLKDCLDALQGRVGGTKTNATRALEPIVPNDRQIWRVIVEKAMAPKESHGRGHLTIRTLGRSLEPPATRRGGGSWGGWSLSLGDHVTGMGATRGAPAAGGG